MSKVFIRNAMDGQSPTMARRKVSDETAFVGAMVPVAPSGLSSCATIGVSLADGLKNFATGDFAGALGRAVQLGTLGAEAIANNASAGNLFANAVDQIGIKALGAKNTGRFFGGRGTPGLNASPKVVPPFIGNKPVLFQFFPEQITDQRSNSVEHITPPGFSLPVPTLAGASERIIGMRLTFARERWVGRGVKDSFRWDKYNFDVAACVQAVRSYAYPIGATAFGLNGGISPQPFMLTLPGTLIGITSDTIGAILTSYNVTYVAFFPDGQPRLAHVDMTMSEVLMNVSQNVTGLAFTNILASSYARAQNAIQPQLVDGKDQTKGLYGKTNDNDVSETNSIPPT